MMSCAVFGVGARMLVLASGVVASLGACSGEATPAKSAEAAPAVIVEAPTGRVAPEPDAADTAEAAPEPAAEAKPAEAKPTEEKPAADPNAQRTVKYVVTPEGLKVEVAGVRFLVSAEAKQVAQGWGVKISVKAESLDGKEHVLLAPKNGPIAFAAAVFKKDSTEAERIADAREGEGELSIGASSPKSFSREFPNKGGRVLAIGETLDIEVGLWGLGESKDDRRPVKQFVHVKMKVDKGKPKAIVEPPASAGK